MWSFKLRVERAVIGHFSVLYRAFIMTAMLAVDRATLFAAQGPTVTPVVGAVFWCVPHQTRAVERKVSNRLIDQIIINGV